METQPNLSLDLFQHFRNLKKRIEQNKDIKTHPSFSEKLKNFLSACLDKLKFDRESFHIVNFLEEYIDQNQNIYLFPNIIEELIEDIKAYKESYICDLKNLCQSDFNGTDINLDEHEIYTLNKCFAEFALDMIWISSGNISLYWDERLDEFIEPINSEISYPEVFLIVASACLANEMNSNYTILNNPLELSVFFNYLQVFGFEYINYKYKKICKDEINIEEISKSAIRQHLKEKMKSIAKQRHAKEREIRQPLIDNAIELWRTNQNPKTGRGWKSYSECANFFCRNNNDNDSLSPRAVASWISEYEKNKPRKPL